MMFLMSCELSDVARLLNTMPSPDVSIARARESEVALFDMSLLVCLETLHFYSSFFET